MRIAVMFAILYSALAAQAQIIDRIAVSVDKEVIAESAILLDRRVTAFLDQAPLDLSGQGKRRSAQRLIDQVLILREASDSRITLPTEQHATALLAQVKQQYGSDEAYQAALKQYGITEADLSAHLLSGLIAYTFSDLRFRPSVQNSDEELKAFFETLKEEGTFESRRDDVEEVLTRQRTEDALDAWLIMARDAARIQFREAVFQ